MISHKLLIPALISGSLLLASCGKNSPFNAENLGNMLGGNAGHAVKAAGHLANASALSEKDEDSLGQSVGVSLTSTYGVYDDEKALKYVTMVGLTVATASPQPNGNYVFGILNTNEVNAFSGPNGYIFVTRGLLAQLDDEAGLAGVLAHEIAHVCNHDGLKQVKAAEAQGAFSEALQTAQGDAARFAAVLDQGVDIITKKGYTQPQEIEADKLGVQIASAAGYDAHSYLRFLQRLQQLQGASAGGQLMSTHPGIATRIGRVTEQLQSLKAGGVTLPDRFAANIAK